MSWNNGIRCMFFYILMANFINNTYDLYRKAVGYAVCGESKVWSILRLYHCFSFVQLCVKTALVKTRA